MESIILTENSFLNLYTFPLDLSIKLIENSILSISDKLIVNPQIFVYGRKCNQHRSIVFFSNSSSGYKYSGQIANSQPLTAELLILLEYINNLFKSEFNGILINKYINGNDYIGAHSDDESNLDNIGVISISYGYPRIFRIRNKYTKKIVKDIITSNDKIIHMGGDFQKEFTHEIPKVKTSDSLDTTRYSITFRKHKN